MIGICKTTFAMLRPEPRHSSELISQVLFGEMVALIEESEDWIKIETEHGYQGFTRKAQFIFYDYVDAFEISKAGLEISTAMFLSGGIRNHKIQVLPGSLFWPGGKFFSIHDDGLELKNISNPKPFDSPELAQFITDWLGIPYVWGGKVFTGLDCSGLIQSLFHQFGYSFPRDAWQQAEIGNTIEFDPKNPFFEKGDLLFFQRPGQKIHHVAISMGGKNYFHASEWSRINSLDPLDNDFVQDRLDTLVLAKQVLTSHLRTLISSFTDLISKGL